MRVMLVVPPIFQLVIFGFAANMDVDTARIGWMDQDQTVQSRELLSYFRGSGRFAIVAEPASESNVQNLLDRGEVDAVVRLLPGFGHDVGRGRDTQAQILVDGTNSNNASIVTSYASAAIARYSGELLLRRQREKLIGPTVASNAPVRAPVAVLSARTRVWFNPDLRSRNYFVPGIVANIITLTTMMLTAMAIVREKEIGTMEQLMVTPVRSMELMLGKTLPFAAVGLVNTTVAVTVAVLLFDVPLRGSVLFLGLCSLLFLMSTLGAGLFISTVSHTQQQAMMTMFLFFMPFFLLSGFAFPIRNMPAAVQWITFVNPVRYFVEIVRGVFLKGSGASVLWPQMLALAVFGTAILTASALRFHKKLD
jgi:ABC-2 type transport system permease protein